MLQVLIVQGLALELFHTLIGREMTLIEGELTFPDIDVTISMTGMRIQAGQGLSFIHI